MASAGGGKIRSRRYHIASKPYAKGKQQGLISRVTDTVKSIVPSWLQSYFRNGEPAAEVGAPAEEPPETHLNSQPPLQVDGQDPSPLTEEHEPQASTSNSVLSPEPSTSRASLNFHDVLARPPLNRTHLHLPSLDSSPVLRGGASTLFSQPSTSTAPYTSGVTTGYSLVKEIKDSGSLHEDDNISTTSGFSSRASDKDVTTAKNVPFMWSPENDRTHPGPQLTGSALKKPAFNLSVFGTSSSSPANSLILNSSKLGDSPFYPGKTTYGGSAAVRSAARVRVDTPYQAPVRRQIKAKGAGSQPCGVTSLTARRILQSLERMSSPLADAKRIPSPCSLALPTALNRSDAGLTHLQSKRKKMEPQLPPVQKLVTPATPPVGGNRSMSFRPCLTPCSNQSSRNSSRSTRQSIPTTVAPALPVQSTSDLYPLSSTPAANGPDSRGSGGKMKRERGIRASNKPAPEDEVVEVPDLPPISLPISAAPLPSFSFSVAPQSTAAASPASTSTPLANKLPAAASSPPCAPFTFSSPIVKATEPNVLPLSPSAGFTFSAPVAKPGLSEFGGKAPPSATIAKSSPAADSQTIKTEEFDGPFQPAKTLKQGSVLDILRSPGFAFSSPGSATLPDKAPPSSQESSSDSGSDSNSGSKLMDKLKPAAGSWSCDACMLCNGPSLGACAACGADRPAANSSPSSSSSSKADAEPAPAPSSGFVALLAAAAGTWECDTCLVQNKAEALKCVACETPKPGAGVKPALAPPASSEGAPATTAAPAATNSLTFVGFGDKFKKPEGAWECDACMVENKAQDSKCVACQSAKPGAAPAAATTSAPVPSGGLLGFGDKFKRPEGDWECDTCCVQNKADAQQCVACQTSKPGAKVEPKGFGSFGALSGSSSGSSFTFGISSSSSSTDPAPASSGGFKFGDQGGFKFGTSSSSTAGFGGGFKFNTGSSSSSATGGEDEKKAESGFKFGAVFGTASGSGASEDKAKSEAPAESESSVAPPKPEEAPAQAPAPGAGFAFSAPKVKAEASTDAAAAPTFSFGKLPEAKLPVGQPLGGFTFGKPAEKEPNEPSAAPPASVPAPASVSAPVPASVPAPTFAFGKAEEKESSTPPSFLFSGAKEAEKPAPPSGFSFCKPVQPFGKPAEKTEAVDAPKPSFSFGAAATDAGAAKPAFGFMAGSAASSSAPAPSLFGAGSAPSSSAPAPAPVPASTFVFGQSSSSEAAPAKTFLFGAQPDSNPQPAAPQSSAPAPSTGQPFLFGSANTTAAPSFNFGGAAPSTASSTVSGSSATPFVFGSAAGSSAPPAFGAGATPAFGQTSSQPSAPAFGSGAPSLFSAPAAQPPAFGVQPGSTFGPQTNATPAFGSTAATSSSAAGAAGGFQFGGPSAFGASGSTPGVFAFGATPGAPAAATPAPAAQTQPVAPGGGFSFNQPLTFNIGSSQSSFNTPTPGSHSISGRKIKTAVRRRK